MEHKTIAKIWAFIAFFSLIFAVVQTFAVQSGKSSGTSLAEMILALMGYPLFIVSAIIIILLAKFTPAFTWLAAWWKKDPLFRIIYRDGTSDYKRGKRTEPESAEVKSDGFYMMTEGSHVLDRKSKVPTYDAFGEFAFTLDKRYAPIIHELRELGFPMRHYGDYQKLIKLAGDDEELEAFLGGIKDPTVKEKVKTRLQKLKDEGVSIKPYKTYKVHDLASMFPNNITPAFVRAKVVTAVTRKLQQMSGRDKILIYGAVALFIIAIAAILLFKFIKGDCPDVETVCSCVKPGIETVQNMTA